jgi:hypothetical protein
MSFDTKKYPALDRYEANYVTPVRRTTLTEDFQQAADAVHDFQVNWLRRCAFNKLLLHTCLLMPFWLGLLMKSRLPPEWGTLVSFHSWGYLILYTITRIIIYAVYDSVIEARSSRYNRDSRASTAAICFLVVVGGIIGFYWMLYGVASTPRYNPPKAYKSSVLNSSVPASPQKEFKTWNQRKANRHRW